MTEHKPAEQLKSAPLIEVTQDMFRQCPHSIMLLEHYRPDGSCFCNDPTHTIMAEWGYEWDSILNRWVYILPSQ